MNLHELFGDDDDFISGNPESKFLDIVFNANNDVVRYELSNLLKRMAMLEHLLDEKLGTTGDETEELLKQFQYGDEETAKAVINSQYVHWTAKILTQSE